MVADPTKQIPVFPRLRPDGLDRNRDRASVVSFAVLSLLFVECKKLQYDDGVADGRDRPVRRCHRFVLRRITPSIFYFHDEKNRQYSTEECFRHRIKIRQAISQSISPDYRPKISLQILSSLLLKLLPRYLQQFL